MKSPFRLGIVGAGFMGSRIGARIAAGDMPRFELCGISDIEVGRAEKLAAELGTVAFERFDQLVETGPDAVYIATPDHLHREPCEAAAAAGVPFLVEKPLATTMEDAEAIVAAVRASGVAAEINFSNRWNPPFAATKAQIVDGRLGAFVTLYSRLNNTILAPTRNLAWADITTSAWFLISHCADLAYWLHGCRYHDRLVNGNRPGVK